jgi:hypothetical protein
VLRKATPQALSTLFEQFQKGDSAKSARIMLLSIIVST